MSSKYLSRPYLLSIGLLIQCDLCCVFILQKFRGTKKVENTKITTSRIIINNASFKVSIKQLCEPCMEYLILGTRIL